MVTDIPIHITQVKCDPVLELYVVAENIRGLIEFLIVVYAGNAIRENCRLFTREIKKRSEYFEIMIHEIRSFCKVEHGVTFGKQNRLTYKSCACLLGLISVTLASAVLQGNFDVHRLGCASAL